ncbi:MAG: GUN4 domain-containing protein, partial [Dolichospermum sp.]
DNFPCADLRTIDKLWVKYSDGRFGFSVQKRIYQGLGGTRKYNEEIWDKFGDKVGWRKGGSWLCMDITYDKKAPEGHLPWTWSNADLNWHDSGYLFEEWGLKKGMHERVKNSPIVGWNLQWGPSVFSRVETCRL